MTSLLIRLFVKDAENTRDARVRERYGVLSGAVGIACNLFLFALKMPAQRRDFHCRGCVQ